MGSFKQETLRWQKRAEESKAMQGQDKEFVLDSAAHCTLVKKRKG